MQPDQLLAADDAEDPEECIYMDAIAAGTIRTMSVRAPSEISTAVDDDAQTEILDEICTLGFQSPPLSTIGDDYTDVDTATVASSATHKVAPSKAFPFDPTGATQPELKRRERYRLLDLESPATKLLLNLMRTGIVATSPVGVDNPEYSIETVDSIDTESDVEVGPVD